MKIIGLILAIIILPFVFLSCDPDRYYNYFITNNCDEVIEIEVIVCTINCNTKHAQITKKPKMQISPNVTQLIHSDAIPQPIIGDRIEYFFENITIIKGNETSKVNYVDKDLWEFKKTSKNSADSYLTVKPEDFE